MFQQINGLLGNLKLNLFQNGIKKRMTYSIYPEEVIKRLPKSEKKTRKFRRLRRLVKEGNSVKCGSILVVQPWSKSKYLPGYFVKYGARGNLVSTVEGIVRYTREYIETHASLKNSDFRLLKQRGTFLHVVPFVAPLPIKLAGFRTIDNQHLDLN